jgi:GNAT superfamily N-acetyltransferase
MRDGDLLPAVAAIRAGGWGERDASLGFALRQPQCYPFVADDDGEIVGTSIATHNGPVGWVGLVFVAPAHRGRGLGAELTSAALRRFEDLGCHTVALAATSLGRPVYERLGFRPDGDYVMFGGSPRMKGESGMLSDAAQAEPVRDGCIRPLVPADLPAVYALDVAASGEDRAHLIQAVPQAWVLDDGHTIRGYAARATWGLGAAIAPDPADGKLLLELLRANASTSSVRFSPLDANTAAVAHLRDIGFQEQDHVVRMLLGAPITWHPTHIWNIFSFAVG